MQGREIVNETKTWYVAQWGKVEECEIVRDTKEFVVLPNGSREKKYSPGWRCYFPTKEEAVEHLIEKATQDYEDALLRAQNKLEVLNNTRGKFGRERVILGLCEVLNKGEGQPSSALIEQLREVWADEYGAARVE